MLTKCEQLAALLPQNIDAALITSAHNRRYLTDFPSSAGMVLVTRQESYFLTDFRYIEAAKQSIIGINCIEYTKIADSLLELVIKHKVQHLAVEDEGLKCSEYYFFKDILENTELCGHLLDKLLKELRIVKTSAELEKIKEAQALTDYGFEYILPRIRAGRTEREISLELEFAIRKQGAESVAFDFIVVSGENSSLPHGVPSDRTLSKGDLVTMDFGSVVDGWHSDMTRTVAVGKCSDEQKHIYNTVLSAQKAALAVLRSGLSCVEGDNAARSIISNAGYGDFFGHGTGHGVGIEIHESPRLSPHAGDEKLSTGNIVTVEPGIYIPGKFGVRIEDMVYITDDGCINLTKSPKELIIV